jgi:hypothetical protein
MYEQSNNEIGSFVQILLEYWANSLSPCEVCACILKFVLKCEWNEYWRKNCENIRTKWKFPNKK